MELRQHPVPIDIRYVLGNRIMNALDGKMPLKTEVSSYSEAHHHDHKNASAIPSSTTPPSIQTHLRSLVRGKECSYIPPNLKPTIYSSASTMARARVDCTHHNIWLLASHLVLRPRIPHRPHPLDASPATPQPPPRYLAPQRQRDRVSWALRSRHPSQQSLLQLGV